MLIRSDLFALNKIKISGVINQSDKIEKLSEIFKSFKNASGRPKVGMSTDY